MRNNHLNILLILLVIILFVLSVTYYVKAKETEKELGEAYNMVNESLAEMQQTREEVNTLLYNLDVIHQLSEEYGLEMELVIAIMRIESNFEPNAISADGKNYGLMQINEVHIKHFEDKMSILDIKKNVEYSSSLLSSLKEENGNLDYILNSYNMGKYGYMEYVQNTGNVSRAYSRDVKKIMQELKGE